MTGRIRAGLGVVALALSACGEILGIREGRPLAGRGTSGDAAAEPADNPSCSGLAPTCGPKRNANCCASSNIAGGSFRRSYDGETFTDPRFTATVSPFALDIYEVTLGRLQRFAAHYSRTMIADGAGKNPNDPSDPGWDPAWSSKLPDSATVECYARGSSPRPSPFSDATPFTTSCFPGPGTLDESAPAARIPWHVAFAFCIWDGGRLPTEAEWNYAAAGGDEQRPFPWGSAAPDRAHAVARSSDAVPDGPSWVGSTSPTGDGKWGQADLAGNVAEWNRDWYVSPYAETECNDCASTAAGYAAPCPPGLAQSGEPPRVIHGGGYSDEAPALLSSYRTSDACTEDLAIGAVGMRCARDPRP